MVMLKMPEMVVVEVVGVCVSKREVVPQRCNSFTFFISSSLCISLKSPLGVVVGVGVVV